MPVYKLVRAVKNPDADRRVKDDWRHVPEFWWHQKQKLDAVYTDRELITVEELAKRVGVTVEEARRFCNSRILEAIERLRSKP